MHDDDEDDGVAFPGATPQTPTSQASTIANAIGARNLMIIIITMPLVFLIVVMATITIFGRPGVDRANDPQIAPASQGAADFLAMPGPSTGARGVSQAAAIAPAPLVIPPEAEISAMALDGDTLVLRLEAEDGGEIIVYDLARGAPVQRIPIMPAIADSEL